MRTNHQHQHQHHHQHRHARRALTWLALGVAAFGAGLAHADEAYPSKPVTMTVPFGPGGTSDIMARFLEQPMAKALGTTLVIDNRAGAGGGIGMSQLARAKPDGYSIGLSVIGPEVLQPAIRKTTYSHANFDHICGTYAVPLMMMVPKASSYKTLADVMNDARQNPGKLTYGSSGRGTLLHLSMEMLLDKAGAKALHVPYKSSGEMVTGLLGGQVMLFNETPTISKQYDLRPIAVFAKERLAAYPSVPTAAEAGFPVEATIWGGVIAPKGLPAEAKGKLEAACRSALATDEYRRNAERVDTPPVYRDGAAFGSFVAAQATSYAELIQRLGLAEKD